MKYTFLSILAALTMIFAGPAVAADSISNFYNDKVIRILTPATGGSYDAYARLVARHLPDHIGGNVKVIVQNMPGTAVKIPLYLRDVASTDSTAIALVNNSVPFAPLFGIPQADYDPTKFNWLGSPTADIGVVVVSSATPVNSIEDATKREVLMGVGGGASAAAFYGYLLNAVLGTKFKMIPGYTGIASVYLAMDQGEVNGSPEAMLNDLQLNKPTWISEKKAKILLQYGGKPSPALPGVPVARDLVKNAEDRELIDAAMAPLEMGRPFVMAPNVPPAIAKGMEAAMMATFKDPAFIDDAKKLKLDVDSAPKSGDDLLAIVASVYGAPQPVRDRLLTIYKQVGN